MFFCEVAREYSFLSYVNVTTQLLSAKEEAGQGQACYPGVQENEGLEREGWGEEGPSTSQH